MKAINLKMGDTFRRNHNGPVHTVAVVKDLDPEQKERTLLKDKIEVTTNEGKSFWMRKDERVSIVQPESTENHG